MLNLWNLVDFWLKLEEFWAQKIRKMIRKMRVKIIEFSASELLYSKNYYIILWNRISLWGGPPPWHKCIAHFGFYISRASSRNAKMSSWGSPHQCYDGGRPISTSMMHLAASCSAGPTRPSLLESGGPRPLLKWFSSWRSQITRWTYSALCWLAFLII